MSRTQALRLRRGRVQVRRLLSATAVAAVVAGAAVFSAGSTASAHDRHDGPGHRHDCRLAWAPPALVDPVTIQLGTGFTSNTLDDNTDYIIRLPDGVKTGATILIGGHNVVIIGGHVRLPTYDPTKSDNFARAFHISRPGPTGSSGTVHIEGVLIDTVGDDGLGDAITIQAPNTIVQVENVRVEHLKGSFDDFHNDVIQPWGGVKELRVDRLSASSDYQGLFLRRDLRDIGTVTVKHTNLVADEELFPAARGGYMVWLSANGANSTGVGPIYHFANVYVQPRADRQLGKTLWPDVDNATNPLAINGAGAAHWPTSSNISGVIHDGAPPDGDFVPEGVAGPDYVSPGYDS